MPPLRLPAADAHRRRARHPRLCSAPGIRQLRCRHRAWTYSHHFGTPVNGAGKLAGVRDMLEQQAAAQQERLSNAAHGPAVPLGCYTFIATLWVSNRSLTRCTSPRPSRIPLSLIALSVVALAIYSDKGTQGAALPRTSVIGIALSLAVLTADRDLSNHRALAAAMPEVESAADMLRTPGRPFTRGYISEALDRAYNRARMTQAGIDIPRDDLHHLRSYNHFHHLGFPPPSHQDMADYIIRRHGRRITDRARRIARRMLRRPDSPLQGQDPGTDNVSAD